MEHLKLATENRLLRNKTKSTFYVSIFYFLKFYTYSCSQQKISNYSLYRENKKERCEFDNRKQNSKPEINHWIQMNSYEIYVSLQVKLICLDMCKQ